MAFLDGMPTFSDVAKTYGDDGKTQAAIIEMLSQENEILLDAVATEANSTIGHKAMVRTGIPAATWRRINQGVGKVKGTTAPVTFTPGQLAVYSEIDKTLAELNGNTAAYRFLAAKGVMEGINQQMATAIFYENQAVNSERITGFAPYYSLKSSSSGGNIIDAAGTGGDNTSIWLIHWSPMTNTIFYPKGLMAGLQHRDFGEQTLKDDDGNQFQGYRDYWEWNIGLAVQDWRYTVRICNIDVSLLSTDTTYLKTIVGYMIDAEEKIQSLQGGRVAWYGNRTIRTALRKAILEKVATNLTEENIAGTMVTSFDGIPFRRTDVLHNAETRVL